MKCSKCGAEIKNFPEHLAGLAKVVCKNCVGVAAAPVDIETLHERYSGRIRLPQTDTGIDSDRTAA